MVLACEYRALPKVGPPGKSEYTPYLLSPSVENVVAEGAGAGASGHKPPLCVDPPGPAALPNMALSESGHPRPPNCDIFTYFR